VISGVLSAVPLSVFTVTVVNWPSVL